MCTVLYSFQKERSEATMNRWELIGNPEKGVYFNHYERKFYQFRKTLGFKYKMVEIHRDSVKAITG